MRPAIPSRSNGAFKQVQLLHLVRFGEAKRLIREGNLTFTQIAERIGIESIYYFSNLFKKQTGMSPTEYEKTLKE